MTDWLSLTKDLKYYIEATHAEGGGNDFMSVGVEIEDSNGKAHHHAIKEIQDIEVTTDRTFEKFIIKVDNKDAGKYKIGFQNPNVNSNKPNVTGLIAADASADDMRKALNGPIRFFSGSNVNVELEKLDKDGAVTTVDADVVSHKYTVTL